MSSSVAGSPFTHPILSPDSTFQHLQSIREDPNSPPQTESLPTSKDQATQSTSQSPQPVPDGSSAAVGDSLLRDYALHIDPLQTNNCTHSNDIPEPSSTISTASTQVDLPGDDGKGDTTAPEPEQSISNFPLRAPKSFLDHRKNAASIDSIPRQTIMKALASRAPPHDSSVPPSATFLPGLRSPHPNNQNPNPIPTREFRGRRHSNSSAQSQRLSAALSNLQVSGYPERSPSTARLPLQSPCFFHQRFDDAVNIEKVLEEVVDDEWMSHSRLMQTATSVREVSKQLQRRPIKRAVRNVMIVTKARDNGLVYLTRELAEWLLSTPRYGNDVGVNVYVDAKLRSSKRFDSPGLLGKDSRYEHMLKYWTPDLCWTNPEKFDLVLTLGGDGTVLFTSWLFQRIVPPILSFSLGSLGFLTNFEFEKYKEHLNRVMGDVGMRVNLRMRFTCTVYRANRNKNQGADASAVEEGEQFEVLNELVIDRGPSPYVSNLEVYGDNELLTVVQADGCIFSTPTGSTAYSLSAGGSLIHPSIPAILLTPICPHTLSFRPMVLSDDLLLRIAVPRASRSTAYCSFDGKSRVELRQGDYVTVEASQYPFPTVVSGGGEWVESVRRALRWNVRGAVQKGWGGGSAGGGATGVEADSDSFHPVEEEEEEEELWDIDTDAGTSPDAGTDSALGPSEDGEVGPGTGVVSPVKRQL
ncbi:NAD(+) kinase [Arachnomyces sp. PD_36]|nr:NAD(+) kinase [Arachnomyces sp. PD_36]